MSLRHAVFPHEGDLPAIVAQYAPTAVTNTTPQYDGYSGSTYYEVSCSSSEWDVLEGHLTQSPLVLEDIPDNSGSFVVRNVKSTIFDRTRAVIDQINAASTVPEKAAALAAASDLLGDMLDDADDRAVDFAAGT